jgi:hypothetical protein
MQENKKDPTGQGDKGQDKKKKKGGLHNDALYAASMGRAATPQVDPHSNRGLANTGTNISYEGPTSPGSGGSVGTGYSSGKPAVEPKISTDSDYDRARVEKDNNEQVSNENDKHDEEKDII